ncbi:MAG: DUF5057 domain-containing protein [Bacillota bacterium]|nr:DUF5057 domain-containing protein [Bacillota bacterium]
MKKISLILVITILVSMISIVPFTANAATSGTGLTGKYYNNTTLTGSPVLTRVDAAVNYMWGTGAPAGQVNSDNFSVEWTGLIQPSYSETYTFYTQSDDGVRLWINGSLIIDDWTDHAQKEDSGTVKLTAGQKYSIKLDYYEKGGDATIQLWWLSNSLSYRQLVPQSSLYPASSSSYNLTLNQTTGGIINSSSSGSSFNPGDSVTLTAIPDVGYVFNGWSGDLTGKTNPATITMDGSKTISATFVSGKSLQPLRILEVEPGLQFDINSTIKSTLQTYLGRTIELTQMPMSLFVSKIDEINGYYDIVYIGNHTYSYSEKVSGTNINVAYSLLGNKITGNNVSAYSNMANTVFKTTNNWVEYLSGIDITNRRAAVLKSFIDSKQLTLFGNGIFSSSMSSTKLYSNFISYYNSKPQNVVFNVTASTLLTALEKYKSTSYVRPYLNITSKPDQYNGSNIISDSSKKLLGYTFDMVGNDNLSVKLYVDANGDGIYTDNEVVYKAGDTSASRLSDTNGQTVNYSIPDYFTGLLAWKLEITDNTTGTNAYETGSTAFKGNELQIRMLQVLPDNTSLDISTLPASSLHKTGEFNIKVDTINAVDMFKNGSTLGTLIKSNNGYNGNQITDLNGKYDMIVVGFQDDYGNDDLNMTAISQLKSFASDHKQSLLLTHDTIWHQHYNYNMTQNFRDMVGQNIYNHNPQIVESGVKKNSLGGVFSSLLYDVSKSPFWETTKTIKINDNSLTQYPNILGDVTISDTHPQYFQIDLEDPELVPLYDVYVPSSDAGISLNNLDPQNFYYTYAKGNITYSGTGHNAPDGVNETQLFVNTIEKASNGANHAPTLTVNGLVNGQNVTPSQSKLDFSILASDVDPDDANLTANIYVDRDNDGVEDPGELVSTYSLQREVQKSISLTADQLNLTSSIQQFNIIVDVLDNDGAKATQTIQLNHKSQPTITVGTNSQNCLIGDNITLNIPINASASGLDSEFRNVSLAVDNSNTSNDVQVSSSSGWTTSGNSYTISLPDVEFNTSAVWNNTSSNSYSVNLPVTILKNANNSSTNYALDIPVTVSYQRYDTVLKTSTPETIKGNAHINVKEGLMNVMVSDSNLKGIDNVSVSVSASGASTDSGTTKSGAVRFNQKKAGNYTAQISVPKGYILAGYKLNGSAVQQFAPGSQTVSVVMSYDNSNPTVEFILNVADTINPDSLYYITPDNNKHAINNNEIKTYNGSKIIIMETFTLDPIPENLQYMYAGYKVSSGTKVGTIISTITPNGMTGYFSVTDKLQSTPINSTQNKFYLIIQIDSAASGSVQLPNDFYLKFSNDSVIEKTITNRSVNIKRTSPPKLR